MYGIYGNPVSVCSMVLIVFNVSSKSKPLSQKPICQFSVLYRLWRIATFNAPIITGWMPYWAKRKSANPIGGMYSRKAFCAVSSII